MSEELRKQLTDILSGLMLADHLGDVGEYLTDLAKLLGIELDGWFGEWTNSDMKKLGCQEMKISQIALIKGEQK